MRTTVADFSKITCILRGYTAQETRLILEVLKDSGIRSVEITMNTEGALSMISEAVERFGDSLSIGAGTVLTMEQLQDVVAAGADFVLSPVMFTREMLDYCRERKVIAVPAAFKMCIRDSRGHGKEGLSAGLRRETRAGVYSYGFARGADEIYFRGGFPAFDSGKSGPDLCGIQESVRDRKPDRGWRHGRETGGVD